MTTVVLEHLQHANSASPDLTVGPDGNIGIGGVAAPSADLEIKPIGGDGELKITSDANSGNNMRLYQGYNSYINASNNVYISAGGNTDMFNLVNGNVGIGTTSPSFATIDTYSQRGIEISGSKETGTAPVIKLTETGSGKGAFEIRSNREGLTSGNYLAFGENADTFMVIRGDDDGGGTARRGNVGIGVTNPFNKLQIGDGAVGGLEDAIGILTHYGNHNTALGKIRWHDGANVTGQIHTQYDGTSVDMHFGHLYNGNYDTTSDLIIKGNGAVITPNSPAFDAYYTTNGTWSVGADNTLVFNATTFNRGGHYNTSNGRFTAPVSGVYHFTFYSIMIGNYTNGDLNLYVNGGRGNGTDRHFTIDTGSNWNTISGSNTRYLNAGDYVMVYSRSGASFHGGYWSNFSGHLVG